MENFRSHYTDLLKIIVEQQQMHPDGIAALTIPAPMSRGDISDIFKEGDLFSSNVREGETEASLTIAASPHFKPSIPLDKFMSLASERFGHEARLPDKAQLESIIAPHLILWWRKNKQGEVSKLDLLDLYNSPRKTKIHLIQCIEKQMVKAVGVLNNFDGTNIVYGTWGYATHQERSKNGLSRGSPTVEDGHFHIAQIGGEKPEIKLRNDLNNIQKLRYYAPWNRLINSKFDQDLCGVLRQIINESLIGEKIDTVIFSSNTIKYNEQWSSIYEGYEILCRTPLQFSDAFSLIVNIAGKIETFYRKVRNLYEEYHRNTANKDAQERIGEDIRFLALNFGFSETGARNLVDFVLRISPTYGQIREWRNQIEESWGKEDNHTLQIFNNKIRKRERFIKSLQKRLSNSLRISLVYDTYKNPDEREIVHTWPVHSSVCYFFDDVFVEKGKVWVRKITLLPSIISTAGVPEKILGVELIRDTGSAC